MVSVGHWASSCDKFALPFCMEVHTHAHEIAVACQVGKFIAYETVTFGMNVHSVQNTLWDIAAYYRAIGCRGPFSSNAQVTTVIQEALEAEALEFTNLEWGAVDNTSFAGNFWIVRTTGIFFQFWRLYCKELQKRELELSILLAAGHTTVTLPQNETITQPTLPTSSRLGMKIVEQHRSESVTKELHQQGVNFARKRIGKRPASDRKRGPLCTNQVNSLTTRHYSTDHLHHS
jgi:hypothetical protein